jgi:hypothetical protein
MRAFRPVLVGQIVMVLVLIAASARCAEGSLITYISSTRFIDGTGIPREDAVGFADFDVNRSVFLGTPGAGGQYNNVFAAQTSRLLGDRIEINLRTGTRYIQQVVGNTMSSRSIAQIVFSLDEAKEITITTGAIFSGSNGGSASVSLRSGASGGTFLYFASEQSAPFTLSLAPGIYRFNASSVSDSLMGIAGSSGTTATLVVPATSSLAMLAGAAVAATSRRRV